MRLRHGLLAGVCLAGLALGLAGPAGASYPYTVDQSVSVCDPQGPTRCLKPVGKADQVSGNSTGTTGVVVGTLAAATGKTTFVCGFAVSAIGGTAAVGPMVLAGVVGSSMTYQLSSAAAGVNFSQGFSPCLPASAAETAITLTTTADGTASAVDVNIWGYVQ